MRCTRGTCLITLLRSHLETPGDMLECLKRRNARFVSVWHLSNKRWDRGFTQQLCAMMAKPDVSGEKEPFCENINAYPFTA